MRRRLPRRRAHVHRRRLQLRRADRRRRRRQRAEPAAQRRAARHLRRDRAGGERGAGGARATATSTRFHAILAPTVPLSRHIFAGADALLQDRRRLPRLAERPPVALRDGRRPAERALAAAPRRAVPPRRRAPACSSSPSSRSRACATCSRCTASTADRRRRACATSPPTIAGSRSTPRRVRGAAERSPDDHRGVRAARHPRASRRGATRSHAIGLERTAAAACATHGLELSGYCRGGMFPALDAAGRRAALDDNRRAVDEAQTLEAPCLVLVVGGLPGALAGSAAVEGPRRGARARCATASRDARVRAQRRHAARDRAAAPDVRRRPRLRQHAGAGARPLRRARRRHAAGALGVAVDVYHVWWDPKLQAQIARAGERAPARVPRLRLARADRATCSTTAA